ncbi:MAG: hypothetical protein VZS44_04505 [Bacilli bacterium]|nr:hypothetical protein [Bacilli bacterium]
MFKFIKNKFLFIIIMSVATLVLLIVGALTLYKNETTTFDSEGYIISTTTKKNAKYYFSANTKYKDNADKKVTFKDNKSNKVAVDPASFVHYNNGSIAFLQKGALVNLNEINSSIISYYNVTRDNLIKKDSNRYLLTSNGEEINVPAFIGRISDSKYIVAGNNLSIEIPTQEEKISGDYFEITYIKDGIVKIDNKDVSYQVTAQNSFVNVGNNIRINLGNEKIYYDGSAKMLLSQITINGEENINLDINKKESGGGEGDGNGTTDTTGAGTETTTTEEGGETTNTTTSETTETTEPGEGEGGKGEGANGGSTEGANNNVKIELINADITSTSIDALFQLNNASLINGKLVATLTNVSNNEHEEPVIIPATNGSFTFNKKALLPNTDYNLTITESGNKDSKQFFQKTFKTKDLGITLEKNYATDSSLSYNINFEQNSEVDKAKIVIYDNTGSNETISPNEFIVTKGDTNSSIEFANLNSNSSYSVSIESVWINNIAYNDIYTINRIDTTLKQTPVISDIQIKANSDEVKFNIKANNIADPDEGIISYIYKIYKSDSINIDGTDPELVYTVNKNDPEPIDLDLTKIDTMKTGVNYRCKIVVQYDDNEMIREAESDYSGNFLIKSKPNISWTSTSTTADRIQGQLSLIDASCSIPIRGRTCLGQNNTFTLRYYKVSDGEANSYETTLDFGSKSLTANVDISSNLSSSTAYAFKLYADYVDDDGITHPNVQIGDPFYVTTDESTKVKFKVKKDNESGKDPRGAEIVTFDASLVKPKDSNADEDTAKIKLKLYSGSYNVDEKLIGTYEITERNLIDDFYNNFTITNVLFENENIGKLDSLQKLIRATSNNSKLNKTYTVEIAEITSQNGSTDSIEVEDKVYTFKLTPSYYLDAMIASSKPNTKFVTVDLIAKKDLTEDEYNELSRRINNLDDLDENTIVGVTIGNSMTEEYVDTAFEYEKVTVDYVIYNQTTEKEPKRISINMDNKYQPKTQTIYLDPIDLDNGENFTRGYNYKIGYELKFVTENGSNPTYTNDKLYEEKEIPRETPSLKQYISTSSADGVTYRYSLTDIDNSLNDKKLYYKVGDSNEYQSTGNTISTDGRFYDITIPISERADYKVYLNTKGTNGRPAYLDFASYKFESRYTYDSSNLYTLANDKDNTLKIKLINNDITNRAVAYKVTIKATDDESITEFNKFFLASRLDEEEIENAGVDEQGNPITATNKYIAIDYAAINRFLQHDLTVDVEAYYDSGLIGINQNVVNGFILERYVNNKYNYLNVYNGTGNDPSSEAEENQINGILFTKANYIKDSEELSLYNYLEYTHEDLYKKNNGAYFYINIPNSSNIGFDYGLEFEKNTYKDKKIDAQGITFVNGTKKHKNFNVKVLKTAKIKTDNNTYRFNSIIPKVTVKNSKATINSLKIQVDSSGIYGQFVKDNSPHNKYYIDIYTDAECKHKITTLTSDINIDGSTITSEIVEQKNLRPDTTYYVTVSAYIDNELTRLYDMDTKDKYEAKVYQLKTYSASQIMSGFYFEVKPIAYEGDSSRKRLEWRMSLLSKENYKIRMELYDSHDNPKKFDGTDATGCDLNSFGSYNNGYVNGCYIQVRKEDVESTTSNDGRPFAGNTNTYTFAGNNFVFGDGYYKLYVYAVPFTNGRYDENDKVTLYEAEPLNEINKGGITVSVKKLKEPNFEFESISTGVRCITQKDENGNPIKDGDNKYVCENDNEDETYIDLIVTNSDQCIPPDPEKPNQKPCSNANDGSFVISEAKYNIYLTDSEGNPVDSKENLSVLDINQKYSFTGLSKNKRYNLRITYNTYLNNVGLTEEEKTIIPQITTNVLTAQTRNVNPGRITASLHGTDYKAIMLNYNGDNEINKITKMTYEIAENPGAESISGEYILSGENANNQFTVDSSNKSTHRLIIDFSDNEDFTLKRGKTYLVKTRYYINETPISDEFGLFDVDLNL